MYTTRNQRRERGLHEVMTDLQMIDNGQKQAGKSNRKEAVNSRTKIEASK
jgi:hypothetical protein